MYLHKDDLFKDVIMEVSGRSGISEDIVEKDYYIYLILKILARINPGIVFKGGTSLSKAYHVIDRFSEDVDVTFTEHIGESRRKKLKYNVIEKVSAELGMPIRNWDTVESDKDYNHYDFVYEQVSEVDAPLPPVVILETALMSYSFPTEEREIGSIIYDHLKGTDPKVISRYGLEPFVMKVQALSRTLVDKMFAVCDYFLLGRARRNSRHLYDIYKIKPFVSDDDGFKNLVRAVREHRAGMDERVAPAAREDIDLIEVAGRICESGFYKEDYDARTKGLISDDVNYDEVIIFYRKLMEDVFGKK